MYLTIAPTITFFSEDVYVFSFYYYSYSSTHNT